MKTAALSDKPAWQSGSIPSSNEQPAIVKEQKQ